MLELEEAAGVALDVEDEASGADFGPLSLELVDEESLPLLPGAPSFATPSVDLEVAGFCT